MYRHKAIDCLNRVLESQVFREGGNHLKKAAYDGLTLMSESLPKCVGFSLVESMDMVESVALQLQGTPMFCGANAADIDPPYEYIWLDFRMKDPDTGVRTTGGLMFINLVDHGMDWVIFLFLDDYGFLMPLPFYVRVFPTSGEVSIVDMDQSGSSKTEKLEVASSMLTMLNVFLLLINSKNITTEVVKAPTKLNKRRQKKGRSAVHDYHVLNVEIPKRSKKYVNSMETGVKQRVHLCRGHFKTFTEDAPMFGKITGRFWWQPLVRGDRTRGLLNKDYKVLANNT